MLLSNERPIICTGTVNVQGDASSRSKLTVQTLHTCRIRDGGGSKVICSVTTKLNMAVVLLTGLDSLMMFSSSGLVTRSL